MASHIRLGKASEDIQQNHRTDPLELAHRPPTPAASNQHQGDIIVPSDPSLTAPPFPDPLLLQREAALLQELRLKLDEVSRHPEGILFSRRNHQSDSASKLDTQRASSAPGASSQRPSVFPPMIPLRRAHTEDSSSSKMPVRPFPKFPDKVVSDSTSHPFSPRFTSRTDPSQDGRHLYSTSLRPRPLEEDSPSFSPSAVPVVSSSYISTSEQDGSYDDSSLSPRSRSTKDSVSTRGGSESIHSPRIPSRSSSSVPLPALSLMYGNYSVLNPLLTNDVVLDLAELRQRCSNLMKISDKKRFDAQEAAKEVAQCLALSKGPELLASTLSELKGGLEGTKKKVRYHELMASLLLYPQAVPFIADYVLAHENCDEFSANVIPFYKSWETPPLSVIYSLSLFTRKELQKQDLETLFRGTNLSTSFCKEYGLQILDTELRFLGRSVKRPLDKGDALNFCLSEKLLQKYIAPVGSAASVNTDARIQENISFCKTYFREMLTQIYQMNLPVECQSLLAMYRAQIAKHFNLTHSDERVEVFTGQLFFLRILNPYLIAQGSSELEVSALVSLTKMTQALANNIPFGTEKQDPIFESFNDIYDEFKIIHQQFINANSL
ncbi:MAG: hypothetical protein AB7O89_07470 [Parachlamydiales bacterium]